jgi:Acyl-CoA dehydrogenases
MNATEESTIDVVRKATRELARNFDYAYWRQKDKRGEYPWEFVKAFAQGGWLGALIPEQYGGLGLGIAECGVMMQEIAASGRRREWRLRGPLLPVPTRARSSATARRR